MLIYKKKVDRYAQFQQSWENPVVDTLNNYESEGRTFESFRARHFFHHPALACGDQRVRSTHIFHRPGLTALTDR